MPGCLTLLMHTVTILVVLHTSGNIWFD